MTAVQRAVSVFLRVNIGMQVGVGIGALVRWSYNPNWHIVVSLLGLCGAIACAILALMFPNLFRFRRRRT